MKKIHIAAVLLFVIGGSIAAQDTAAPPKTIWYTVSHGGLDNWEIMNVADTTLSIAMLDALVYQDIAQQEGWSWTDQMGDATWRLFFTITAIDRGNRTPVIVGSVIVTKEAPEYPNQEGLLFYEWSTQVDSHNGIVELKEALFTTPFRFIADSYE